MPLSRPTQLAILQQSEYLWPTFERWIDTHQSYTKELQPAWTLKTKLINLISQLFFFFPVTESLHIALQILAIPEALTRWMILRAARAQLAAYQQKGLQVVAIAGSYAKTSTKMSTGHLLGQNWQVCVTPDSYNTPLGIASVIRNQLKAEHQLFIVEFGEFLPGEIQKLLNLTQPNFGVLTPMGRQHLEILGGLDGLTAEMQTFVKWFEPHHLLVNEQSCTYFPDLHVLTYGEQNQSDYKVTSAKISRAGTEFEAKTPTQHFTAFSPIYGKHQAVNTLPAFWLAEQLKADIEPIVKRANTLPYIPRRHQPTFAANDILILDNSFNTNPDAVTSSLELLTQLSPSKVFVVTLGFVEQGSESKKIHYEFGKQLATKADAIGLIQGPHTADIKQGYIDAGGDALHVFIGETQESAFAQLQNLVVPGSVVLFEGGFQEVFS